MAQEHAGPQAKTSWMKIFTAFKVALDLKNLLLAAAGILITALGWWLVGWTFHGVRGWTPPKFVEDSKATDDEKKVTWTEFRVRRASWNLMHELAGPPSDMQTIDAADVTNDLKEFELLNRWETAYRLLAEPIAIKDNALSVPSNKDLKIDIVEKDEAKLKPLREKSNQNLLTLASIKVQDKGDKEHKFITIDGVWIEVTGTVENLKTFREQALDLRQIETAAAAEPNPLLAQKALEKFRAYLVKARPKASGRLRTWPWFEYRGPNPAVVVGDMVKTGSDPGIAHASVLNWFVYEEMPVLVEPLVKFLMPLAYLFDARAGGWDRLYLIMVMLWTLVVWGFFGGAICRIAAVRVARNERITLAEAIQFARERFVSYVVAPVFPLVLLAVLVVVLIIFGWIEWVPFFGDIYAGLFWPVVLVIGFIMAVVLVGLVGWPLMNATISTEGSDSFDALSRSYSYVYQAPWHYLWYNLLALLYGVVLVFFVGFMASLIVFVGKWSVASAPGLARADEAADREPSYLFDYAPTSFGWRDLLISSSPFVEEKTREMPVMTQKSPFFLGSTPLSDLKADEIPVSRRITYLDFTPKYRKEIGNFNRFGAFLVSIWVYLFFLLVVGFGYSYFWSVSTIIYFLMRQHVDDTDFDEVHLEDEGMEDPFLRTVTPPTEAAAPAAPGKPGTVSLNVIVGPPPSPPPPAPPSNATPTMLAPTQASPQPTTVDNPPPTPPAPPTPPEGSS